MPKSDMRLIGVTATLRDGLDLAATLTGVGTFDVGSILDMERAVNTRSRLRMHVETRDPTDDEVDEAVLEYARGRDGDPFSPYGAGKAVGVSEDDARDSMERLRKLGSMAKDKSSDFYCMRKR